MPYFVKNTRTLQRRHGTALHFALLFMPWGPPQARSTKTDSSARTQGSARHELPAFTAIVRRLSIMPTTPTQASSSSVPPETEAAPSPSVLQLARLPPSLLVITATMPSPEASPSNITNQHHA